MLHIIVEIKVETKNYHIHTWYNSLCRISLVAMKQIGIRKQQFIDKKNVDNLCTNRYNSRSRHLMTKQIGLWKLNREIGKDSKTIFC